MLPAEDVYLIVVAGAMNPAIHHPAWYELRDILTAEEVAKASQSGVVVTSPQVAQFNVGTMSITCDPARWQIQTIQESDLLRAVEIAEKTFNVLFHTPISAFGFNFLHHKIVGLANVARVLGGLVRSLPVGFLGDGKGPEAGKLNYERSEGGRVIRTALEPSVRGENQVYIAINVEHRFDSEKLPKFQQFDLKLADHFSPDRRDAQEQLANVLRAMEALARGERGLNRNGA